MTHVSVNACAKINLGLLITGRRQDGYHTLETVFAPINWFDVLEFKVSDTISMSCSNLDLPSDDTNLCVRAAKALQKFAGVRSGVEISLLKQIPFGAGLGGGSSDAAATLRELNILWGIEASSKELHRIAVTLGADVPYFLDMKGLAYAAGIGEELEDLSLALPYHVVTVFPEVQVPTVWAYRNFRPQFDRQVPDLKTLAASLCRDRDLSVLDAFENDFEPVVFEHYPVVLSVRDAFLEAGALFASMSGSGSAVYALFDDAASAATAAEEMQINYRVNITPPGFFM
jgi:4-diphosphocytidyl-2-C-methyl-D-erythritol kinase